MMRSLPHSFFSLSYRASLALLLSSAAFATEARAEEAPKTVEISDRARDLFRAGVAFMQDPDGARYEEAYHAFESAYQESPSWKILGNLGIVAMKLERDGKAIESFETYLKEGKGQLEKAEVDQVERDLSILKTGVTYVELTTNITGASVIDQRSPFTGDPIFNRYPELGEKLVIGVHGGRHKMTVELEGYEPLTWKFEAKGDRLTHHFELKKIKEKAVLVPVGTKAVPESQKVTERPVTTATWITLGAAGALGAGAAVTGYLALEKNKDFDKINGVDPDEAEKLRNSGQVLNLTTDILIGAAVVSAGAAAYLYFTRPEVVVEQDVSFQVLPHYYEQGGGLSLSGCF